jgi:putative RecB family exonuclease
MDRLPVSVTEVARRHRSVSQLKQFSLDCSWGFKLSRIDRVAQLPAAWTHGGTAFHEACEGWEKSGRNLTIRETQEIFYRSYDALIERSKQEWPDPKVWLRGGNTGTQKDIDNRRERGGNQVENYIIRASNEGLTPVIIDGELLVETELRLDAGEFDVLGYADVILWDVYGNVLIRDLKTGNRPSFDIQPITYGYALEETKGIKAWWGDYYLAKTDEVTAPVDLSCVPKGMLLQWYQAMDRQANNGEYIPNPGGHCFTCSVKSSCDFSV